MIKESRQLYQTFIEMNESSFEGRLYVVAYHALSAALYCALATQDTLSLRQVEQLASKQLQTLTEQFKEQGARSEPLEITLYTSLLRIANPRQSVARDHATRDGHGIFLKGHRVFDQNESLGHDGQGITHDGTSPLEDGSNPA